MHIISIGTASGIVDGAVSLMVCSEEYVKQHVFIFSSSINNSNFF